MFRSSKKLNSVIRKHNFFFSGINFTYNDGSLKAFVYQATLDALELKKDKVADCSWLEINGSI